MLILGIDFGTKRIGLAVGDSSSSLAFPLRSVDAQPLPAAIASVLEVARAESVDRLVVGVPRRLSGAGEAGDTERQALAFADALRDESRYAVDTEDERMTTGLVERWRKMSGKKRGKFDKDAAAAAAIVETYMGRVFGPPRT